MKENAEKGKPKKDEGSVEIVNDAYFSYPYRFWVQDAEKMDKEEMEKTKTEIEQKFLELLKGINEETLQLSEIAIEEKKLAHELCDLLKQILFNLKMSITIPSKAVPSLKEKGEIILNAHGNLILVSEEGKVDSKLLEDCPSEIILMVAWSAIPQLKKSISLYRKQVGLRVNFFNKINRELNNINEAFLTSKKQPKERDLEELLQEDEVKKLFREERAKKPIRKDRSKKPIREDEVKKLLQEDEVKKLFREDGVKKFLDYYKVKVKGRRK